MSQTRGAEDLPTMLRTGRVVTIALTSGIVLFLLVTAVLPRAPGPIAADPWSWRGPLTTVALIAGWITLLVNPFLQDLMVAGPMATLARASRTAEAQAERGLTGLYLTRLIVGSAILEGAAVFNVIAFWLEGSRLNLALALLLALVLLSRIPTRGRAEAWIEQRRLRLEELRQAFPEEHPF